MDLEKLTLPLEVADKAFNAGVAAAAAGVTALIGTMAAAVKLTFDWAGELDSIGDVMDVTTQEAAALNFVLRKSGTETETLTKGMTILNKGLVKTDGTLDTAGKALKGFGINVKNANGTVKNNSDLMSEIAKKYNSFSTQQEKVNFLTEAFGRSGADLIDFFDVLAKEGGIEDVTEKVKRLGLVIDPGRYENFTRSLEELKLVGLGLAVGFTESVMPAFERFLEIITGPGTLAEKAGTLLSEIDSFIGGVIDGFAVSIDDWVASGGPEELTDKLIAWIEGIGEGEGTQSKILTAAGKLVSAIAKALGEVDWAAIGTAIDAKLTELFTNADWSGSGASFGNSIDKAFATELSTGESAGLPMSVVAFGEGINKFFLAASGADKFGGWKAFFVEWDKQSRANSVAFWAGLWESFSGGMVRFFNNWERTWSDGIRRWGVNIYNDIIGWINKIYAAINGMQDFINITPIPSAAPGAGQSKPGRASGGPVIGGQTYYAHAQEIFKDGSFTAPSSGRIDPMGSGGFDMSMLTTILQQFADEISRSNRMAFEKVGR